MWLIENILRKEKDVLIARVNLSQNFAFNLARAALSACNEIANLINQIGYKLLPFDEKIFNELDKI